MPRILSSLGASYRARFALTEALADLEQAIALCQQAVDAAPEGRLDRPIYLLDASEGYLTRYMLSQAPGDLDLSIVLGEEAVAISGNDYPRRAALLGQLAQTPLFN